MRQFLPFGQQWWVGPWALIAPITAAEAYDAFWALNLRSAAGIDFVSVELASQLLFVFLPFVIPFFNALLRKGLWPALWAISKISVLPKNVAAVTEPSDTRGVHVLCLLAKWFKKIFVKRLHAWKGVNPFQAGFVPGARTVDHVFLLYVLFCAAQFQRRPLFVVFVDVVSCFPSILGTLMLLAWWSFGVGGSWCRLLVAGMVAGRAFLTYRGIRSCWIPNTGGVTQGGVHGPVAHNVFARDGPTLIGLGREEDADLPRVGKIRVAAADFADDRVLPAFSHQAAQNSINKMAAHYKHNCQEPNKKKTVVLIFDPTGVISYNDGDTYYTRADVAGHFALLLNGAPLTFVDSFRYLGILFHKTGDFEHAASRTSRIASGKMWAILAKIRSLFVIPFAFALMLFKAIVQGGQAYGAEVWLPLVRTDELDRTFCVFIQHFFHLHNKTGRLNTYLLADTIPFHLWARKLVVSFLLRAVAAPYDTLIHQCVVQLLSWHLEGKRNWLSTVMEWIQAWDGRFGLRLNTVRDGWSSVSFAWVPWDERAPQRQWRFPGTGWGYGPQMWATSETTTEAEWRQQWAVLVGWGKRVAERYAAFERSRFILREQYGRVAKGGPYAKSRILKSAWLAGAPVGGLPLPLVAPRLPAPRTLIDKLTGPARRSVAARFFTGDLDIAAYSGNWDLNRHTLPPRACAHCYWRYQIRWVEDEWHIFFVCPLYETLRRALPFTGNQVRVVGHIMQGDGCQPRNLISLVRHIMALPRIDGVVDFLLQAMKRRRESRQNPFPFQ